MSIHRRAARRDNAEAPIIEALRAAGASVVQLDVIDLLVGYAPPATGIPETFLLEIKTEKGKLTKSQIEFIKNWRGGKIGVARTPEEALKIIGAIE